MDGMSSDISACVIGTQIRLLTPLLVGKMRAATPLRPSVILGSEERQPS